MPFMDPPICGRHPHPQITQRGPQRHLRAGKAKPRPAEAEPGALGGRITHLEPKRLTRRRVARRSTHTANVSPPKVATAATTRISRS